MVAEVLPVLEEHDVVVDEYTNQVESVANRLVEYYKSCQEGESGEEVVSVVEEELRGWLERAENLKLVVQTAVGKVREVLKAKMGE